jgi:hypothetical protein
MYNCQNKNLLVPDERHTGLELTVAKILWQLLNFGVGKLLVGEGQGAVRGLRTENLKSSLTSESSHLVCP